MTELPLTSTQTAAGRPDTMNQRHSGVPKAEFRSVARRVRIEVAQRAGHALAFVSATEFGFYGTNARLTALAKAIRRKGHTANIHDRWDCSARLEFLIQFQMIVKRVDGYYVLSETTGRNLGGPYRTLEQAKTRLRQVEYFKRHK